MKIDSCLVSILILYDSDTIETNLNEWKISIESFSGDPSTSVDIVKSEQIHQSID